MDWGENETPSLYSPAHCSPKDCAPQMEAWAWLGALPAAPSLGRGQSPWESATRPRSPGLCLRSLHPTPALLPRFGMN